MFSHLLPQDWLRRYLLRRQPPDDLRRYLETPLPDPRRSLDKVELLALDFETTGLDPRTEAILSIGYVVVRNRRIQMAERAHHQVQVNTPIPAESVRIHHITDARAQSGEHLSTVMPALLAAMTGRVVLVHFAGIERGFLDAACRRLYGCALPLRLIDTLALEHRRASRRQTPHTPGELRLFNLRERYGLPRYQAHNALSDAIATAELFLVQAADRQGAAKTMSLRDVLC